MFHKPWHINTVLCISYLNVSKGKNVSLLFRPFIDLLLPFEQLNDQIMLMKPTVDDASPQPYHPSTPIAPNAAHWLTSLGSKVPPNPSLNTCLCTVFSYRCSPSWHFGSIRSPVVSTLHHHSPCFTASQCYFAMPSGYGLDQPSGPTVALYHLPAIGPYICPLQHMVRPWANRPLILILAHTNPLTRHVPVSTLRGPSVPSVLLPDPRYS